MNILERFNNTSKTGRRVLILKAIRDCDCIDKDDLLDSEPKISCKKCLGTGKEREFVITQKIRYDLKADKSIKHFDNSGETSDIYSFFFPDFYKEINSTDIIATIADDGTLNKIFEVENKFEFFYNEFNYVEIFCNKIHYIKGFEELNEKFKKIYREV